MYRKAGLCGAAFCMLLTIVFFAGCKGDTPSDMGNTSSGGNRSSTTEIQDEVQDDGLYSAEEIPSMSPGLYLPVGENQFAPLSPEMLRGFSGSAGDFIKAYYIYDGDGSLDDEEGYSYRIFCSSGLDETLRVNTLDRTFGTQILATDTGFHLYKVDFSKYWNGSDNFPPVSDVDELAGIEPDGGIKDENGDYTGFRDETEERILAEHGLEVDTYYSSTRDHLQHFSVCGSNAPTKLPYGKFEGTQWTESEWVFDTLYYAVIPEEVIPLSKTKEGYFVYDFSDVVPGTYIFYGNTLGGPLTGVLVDVV